MEPDRYTHGHHESVLRSHVWRTADNSAGYLLPELRPGLDLLDVGCGPATLTADLATLVAPGRVVAVDNAPAVLDVARRTLAERGRTAVEVRQADVYDLPFSDDSFDVVHAHQLLQHLADPVAALEELRRVCRPGGVVAARDADYPAMAWYPEDPALERWRALYVAVARSNGAEPGAGRRLLAWARRAGFAEVEPSASVWCHATAEDRTWWGGLWAERITSSAVADQALAAGLADRRDLEDLAAAWRRWAASPEGWFAVLHGEVRCRG